jgi:hypothetical protein
MGHRLTEDPTPGRRSRAGRWPLAPALVLLVLPGCPTAEPDPYVEPYLGAALDAGFEDPLLLTFAAPRETAEYRVDEGYTLTRDEDQLLWLATDTAGDLGLAVELDGELRLLDRDLSSPATIRYTGSDAALLDLELEPSVALELRFATATSRVAVIELWVNNRSDRERELAVIPYLRRCYGPYTNVATAENGVQARHTVEIPEEEQLLAPGTYVDDAADALWVDKGYEGWTVLETCSHDLTEDLASLAAGGTGPSNSVSMMALRAAVTLPPESRTSIRIQRGVAPQDEADRLDDALATARALDTLGILERSYGRLTATPPLAGLGRSDELVYRSSFVLLDQLMMPPEGNLDRAYYLFSREPTWWFARLGQHSHESLAMLAMARFHPELAESSHRIWIDRIEDDGYLPYNVGPVVEQTSLGTTTAPLLAYEGWELARVLDDPTFLEDAYETAARFRDYWVTERDTDGDGLCEFGGFAVTESVRDLNNVIWEEVAPPEEVEAVDLNSWLVMEERTLANMARALGRAEEAAAWDAATTARAALINTQMWDEETGFYYHVARDDNSFDYAAPGDLKRMEIAGFMPMWAGIVPGERLEILLEKLTDPERFWREYGVPGLSADDPSYAPQASGCCRWDGPVWVQWQYLLFRALLRYHRHDLAAELTDRTLAGVRAQLVEHHQFRELYDPDDAGRPNESMPNYIWSPLVALMMLEAEETR